jgi:hypothetical protein
MFPQFKAFQKQKLHTWPFAKFVGNIGHCLEMLANLLGTIANSQGTLTNLLVTLEMQP